MGLFIVPVLVDSLNGALKQVSLANKRADLIELRIDFLSKDSLSGFDFGFLLSKCEKPVLVTCRRRSEGGFFDGSNSELVEVLSRVLKFKPGFVDVEYSLPKVFRKKLFRIASRFGVKVFLSKHFLSETPSLKKLRGFCKRMFEEGAFVVKIVCFANDFEDNFRVLSLFDYCNKFFGENSSSKVRLISFCMGGKGVISRVVCGLIGFGTFVSLKEGFESASGQLSVFKMKRVFDLLGF